MIKSSLKIIVFVLMPSFFLVGCSFTSGFKKSIKKNVQSKTFTVSSSVYFNESDPVVDWWAALKDDDLSSLIYEAVDNNLDVKIAMANIDKARAITGGVEVRGYPRVDGVGSYTREHQSQNGVGQITDRSSNTYTAGFDAFWEIDFFGRLDQRLEQAQALTDQLRADLQSVYVAITAEVARYYIQLRGAQRQLTIARENVTTQKKTYQLIQNLFEAGRATSLDVARAQSQLETTMASIPSFEAEIDTAIYRLGVLIGQEPTVLYDELKVPQSLPSVPVTLSVGDPQALLRRRPDIRSAEYQLQQKVNQYNLAIADWFPKVDITGGLGFLSTSLSDLGKSSSVYSSISPSITWKILDFKRVQARVDEADADIDGAVATYQKTILIALEDVQSSMTRFAKENERRDRLREAAAASIKAAEIARIRFESGLDNFLDVLDAEQRRLLSENALAESEIQVALNLVAVYKSLGGGWEIH